jgi:putative flippase GtrA
MNKVLGKLLVFSKAQLSAFVGGMVDYGIMILITELFYVHYTITIVIGGIIGALVNFSLNKYWTFPSKVRPYSNSMCKQLLKFVLVALNSILLKSSGTYFVTSYIEIDYKISRLIIDLFVSLMFNYNLQRYWVFRKVK